MNPKVTNQYLIAGTIAVLLTMPVLASPVENSAGKPESKFTTVPATLISESEPTSPSDRTTNFHSLRATALDRTPNLTTLPSEVAVDYSWLRQGRLLVTPNRASWDNLTGNNRLAHRSSDDPGVEKASRPAASSFDTGSTELAQGVTRANGPTSHNLRVDTTQIKRPALR